MSLHPAPIGILTFHNGPNYGAFMQAWHLREAIRSLGYDAHTINYLHPTHLRSNCKRVVVRDLSSLKARIHWILKRYPFRDVGKILCDDPFTSDPAAVPWDKYGTIVVGSDVVWDFQDPDFGHDPAYFGMLPGQKGCHMISYAASCGPADVDAEIPNYCSGLERFHSIGVRDAATVKLVTKITGREPELVVDPTWLQDDPEICWRGAPKRKYVVVYGTGMSPEFAKALREHCDKRGLSIVSAAASCKVADRTYRALKPFQWVDLIRKAEACVIGGLHGTLYSIKYRKPFLLINNARTRQKAQEALARSGQAFRGILPEDVRVEHISLLERDSGVSEGIPVAWQESSWNYLRSALSTNV